MADDCILFKRTGRKRGKHCPYQTAIISLNGEMVAESDDLFFFSFHGRIPPVTRFNAASMPY